MAQYFLDIRWLKGLFFSGLMLINLFMFTKSVDAQQSLRLWYQQPAAEWQACLPLGNGRLGMMPDDGIATDHIVLNDITLWSGAPQDADKTGAEEYLPQIRKLLFEGKNDEAEALINKVFVCKGPGSGRGSGANVPYGSYQMLGDLRLNFDYGQSNAANVQDYERELSLENAVAKCQFTLNGVTYYREYFASFSGDVLVIRLTCDQPAKLNMTLSVNRPERYNVKTDGRELQMFGQMNNGTDGKGMQYLTRIKMKPEGGKLIAGDTTLQLKQANAVTIYISSGTDFKEFPYVEKTSELLRHAMDQPYETMKEAHIQEYQKLFKRASLNLSGASEASNLPTDQRLKAFTEHPDDNGLVALYFQFGRYLLISSTRPDLLPPNLQGLWANTIQTPWNGDYHLDINIEMNHWPLEVTNLPMLNQPFYALIKGLMKPGEKTAKIYYGGQGWVAHVITNVWGYTSPGESASWGATNSGSGWLCEVLWRHFEFTGDTAYLREIYPVIKGSAEFYLSTLVKDPNNGWLVTAPSNSPENAFRLPDGKTAHVCVSPTIDNQIIRELFTHVVDAAKVLGIDRDFSGQLVSARAQLPPNQIGKDGRLMEWLKEYEEVEPHHRHTSHLWGLYPGNEITVNGTPELAKAAEKSLIARGDMGTGWSLAWKVNFWARLADGDHAFRLLHRLLRPTSNIGYDMQNGGGTYPNLFCAHPPYQIDGNFGGTAGIAEMLVQSHAGYIDFLPALPDLWKTGNFEGLAVRGGGVVSAKWDDGMATEASLHANISNTYQVKLPHNVQSVEVKIAGNDIPIFPKNGLFELKLEQDQTANFTFRP